MELSLVQSMTSSGTVCVGHCLVLALETGDRGVCCKLVGIDYICGL